MKGRGARSIFSRMKARNRAMFRALGYRVFFMKDIVVDADNRYEIAGYRQAQKDEQKR